MIIGISGLTEDPQGNRGSAGAGKSEVAKRLVEKHGFVEVALADEIKRICMRLWDFSEEQLWGPSAERNKPDERYTTPHLITDSTATCSKCGVEIRLDGSWDNLQAVDGSQGCPLTPRHALQQIGTEVARAIDPDVWVRYTMKAASDILEEGWHYHRTRGSYAGSSSSRIKGMSQCLSGLILAASFLL